MKNPLSVLTGLFRGSWWVKLATQSPRCDYYFGPFASEHEATRSHPGYVEDLAQEGSEVLELLVMRRHPPAELTVEYLEAA